MVGRLIKIPDFMGNLYLSLDLSQRSLCDEEESNRFFIRPSLIAFRNVACNTDRGSSDLISQSKILTELTFIRDFINSD